MEIKASSVYDLKAFKALQHLTMFKGKNPRKQMIQWYIISFIVFAICIFNIIAFDFIDFATLGLIIAVTCICIIISYLYFLLPKIQYNSFKKPSDIKNQFIFTDSGFKVFSEAEGYEGSSSIDYSTIFKVMETSEYFFIFENRIRTYIVDKGSMDTEQAETLRHKLMSFVSKKNYKLCKY